MSTMRPHRSVTADSTVAGFPAVKHFFTCKETAGTVLRDSIGTPLVTATSMAFPDAYSVNPMAVNVALTSGSFAAIPSTADTLLFLVGNPGVAGAVAIGNTTSGQGDMMAINAFTTPSCRKNATTVNATAITASASHAHGILVDFGGNVVSFDTNGGTYNAKAPVALTGVTDMNTLQSFITVNGYTSVYGILVMSFTSGLPVDIATAALWMEVQWKAGNKVIYPGWRNKT